MLYKVADGEFAGLVERPRRSPLIEPGREPEPFAEHVQGAARLFVNEPPERSNRPPVRPVRLLATGFGVGVTPELHRVLNELVRRGRSGGTPLPLGSGFLVWFLSLVSLSIR